VITETWLRRLFLCVAIPPARRNFRQTDGVLYRHAGVRSRGESEPGGEATLSAPARRPDRFPASLPRREGVEQASANDAHSPRRFISNISAIRGCRKRRTTLIYRSLSCCSRSAGSTVELGPGDLAPLSCHSRVLRQAIRCIEIRSLPV